MRRVAQTGYKAGKTVGGVTSAATARAGSDARTRGRKAPVFVAGAVGAAGAYFFDPDTGNRRRAVARDRVTAFFRQRGRDASRFARTGAQQAKGRAEGAVAEATPSPPKDLNDPALENKVQSEIFRAADAPKGEVNVNVENGVVYLRGQVDSAEQIEKLVDATHAVEGVRGVENLLHTPGESPPTKHDGTSSPSRAKAKT